MDDLIWCTRISATRHLCVSALSPVTVQENQVENLGTGHGYFIYEVEEGRSGGGISILGKAASEEAAMRLVNIFLSAKKPHESGVRKRA